MYFSDYIINDLNKKLIILITYNKNIFLVNNN